MSGPKHTPGVLSGPCPVCMGVGTEYDAMVPGGLLHCPDCGSTGKAANSITANEKLRDAAPRLAAALKEIAHGAPTIMPTGLVEREHWRLAKVARAALREAGVES